MLLDNILMTKIEFVGHFPFKEVIPTPIISHPNKGAIDENK